jgi:thiol-disulfide isomerase/thioredoxin
MRMLLAAVGAVFVIAAPAPAPVAAAAVDGANRHGPATLSILVASAETRRADHPHDSAAGDPESGAELLGQPAPPWTFTRWIGPPLSLEALRGKVVLLRWWTEGCHFCATTLPELEALRRAHDGDLVVIGVFHPKPPREVSDRRIAAVARRLGFSGRIAVDRDWTTLDRYWLARRPERSWTSVSFLIDRKGMIRWVHGGGEYHPSDDPAHARCALEYRELERTLAEVLAEPASAAATP